MYRDLGPRSGFACNRFYFHDPAFYLGCFHSKELFDEFRMRAGKPEIDPSWRIFYAVEICPYSLAAFPVFSRDLLFGRQDASSPVEVYVYVAAFYFLDDAGNY